MAGRLDVNGNGKRLEDLKFYYSKNKIISPENTVWIFRFIAELETGENEITKRI